MKRNGRKGLTLLEIMIGIFLITSSTLVFIKILNSFKKETTFYSEHFLASSLNEKILETCFQETDLNLYGFRALGIVDSAGDPIDLKTMITDGQTPFFQNPEITQAEAPILHQKLKDNFSMSIKCTTENKKFYEVETTFGWTTQTGKGSSSSVCRFLTFDGDKEVETTLSIEDSVVESRLLNNVFNSSVSSIDQVVSSFGAQELLMAIGHIYYPCFDLISSKEFFDRCAKLEAMESPSFAPGSSIYSQCSEGYFSLAKDLLHLLMYIKPHLELIKEKQQMFIPTIKPEYLPNTHRYLLKAMEFTKRVQSSFILAITKLTVRYEKQFDSEFYLRDKKKMLQRLFNLYRILYACRNNPDVLVDAKLTKSSIESRISVFLAKLETGFKSSSPSISRLAQQEKRYMAEGKLAASYFVANTVEVLLKDVDELAKLKF